MISIMITINNDKNDNNMNRNNDEKGKNKLIITNYVKRVYIYIWIFGSCCN